MLKYPSVKRKNRNAPNKVHNTPSVVLLVAACERVYTSGKRMMPKALKRLNSAPNINSDATITSLITVAFNDYTPFNKSCKGYSTDKGKDADQEDDLQKCMCVH